MSRAMGLCTGAAGVADGGIDRCRAQRGQLPREGANEVMHRSPAGLER